MHQLFAFMKALFAFQFAIKIDTIIMYVLEYKTLYSDIFFTVFSRHPV